ncbi:hypothetical protein BTA51_11775 [Hahella sp. CCB-MM4]|uniref:hypothetical protein n=1 Tax=Hahella sp. (strain CCB-MM4) TaxID=1926491 RepID=UPI000B9B0219|nr:hypothetical protein [Hahella sp. CCB-MM4]OZG73164.1 hypothetical protein BTA51_11775 [Hahella sp. CCB-MM4]
MSSSKVEYFIGGGGDKSDFITSITGATNIMRRVKEYRANTTSDIYCQYYGHEEKIQILQDIQTNWKNGTYKSIRLTGHSWGGQAAMDLTQQLFKLSIPVDELITLDPVSLFPFSSVNAAKWVNVYCKQSIMDLTVGAVPIIGNFISALTTWPGMTGGSTSGDYVANVGGQLGSENGALNVEMDTNHEDALALYQRARKEIQNAPLKPKAIGIK